MPMLVPDDQFPAITLSLAGGGELYLPEDLSGSWAYLALYRGGW